MNTISVIIPCYREGNAIAPCLESVFEIFDSPEVIVCDGSADEETKALAVAFGARYAVPRHRRRAAAMNTGAELASGDLLLFLHADSILPTAAKRLETLDLERFGWGGFYKWFTPNNLWLTLHAITVNLWKIELWREFLGDNSIFVRRELFEELGGYRDLHLFEDFDLSGRLRATSSCCAVIRKPSLTSSRRFQKRGAIYTLYFMQRCRRWFAQGVDTAEILRRYESLESPGPRSEPVALGEVFFDPEKRLPGVEGHGD